MIQLRLPETPAAGKGAVELRDIRIEDGWLGDIETGRISAYAEYDGEKAAASWFPNEAVAKAWAGFSYPEAKNRSSGGE